MPRHNPAAAAASESELQAAVASAPVERTTRVLPTSLPGREMHTGDFAEPALSDIRLPELGAEIERGDTQVAVAPGGMSKEYMAELAFMEEPVTIRIEPANDENPAMTVDCWVQGKGAEVKDARSGKWLELNFLPVNIVCTTKRKYVEVLARSKQMKIRTPDHGDGKNIDNNNVQRNHIRGHVFSVIRDTDKGAEWLTRIMSESF